MSFPITNPNDLPLPVGLGQPDPTVIRFFMERSKNGVFHWVPSLKTACAANLLVAFLLLGRCARDGSSEALPWLLICVNGCLAALNPKPQYKIATPGNYRAAEQDDFPRARRVLLGRAGN